MPMAASRSIAVPARMPDGPVAHKPRAARSGAASQPRTSAATARRCPSPVRAEKPTTGHLAVDGAPQRRQRARLPRRGRACRAWSRPRAAGSPTCGEEREQLVLLGLEAPPHVDQQRPRRAASRGRGGSPRPAAPSLAAPPRSRPRTRSPGDRRSRSRSLTRKKLSCRVRPGVLLVRARPRRPSSAFRSDDLPTFERPATATSGRRRRRPATRCGRGAEEPGRGDLHRCVRLSLAGLVAGPVEPEAPCSPSAPGARRSRAARPSAATRPAWAPLSLLVCVNVTMRALAVRRRARTCTPT